MLRSFFKGNWLGTNGLSSSFSTVFSDFRVAKETLERNSGQILQYNQHVFEKEPDSLETKCKSHFSGGGWRNSKRINEEAAGVPSLSLIFNRRGVPCIFKSEMGLNGRKELRRMNRHAENRECHCQRALLLQRKCSS